jgi:hypothetical protein
MIDKHINVNFNFPVNRLFRMFEIESVRQLKVMIISFVNGEIDEQHNIAIAK